MRKYRCTFSPFIEDIIEAENQEAAKEEFWENNDLSDLDIFLIIKEYRKKKEKLKNARHL